MLNVIKSTNNDTIDTGFKAAGGVRNVDDALVYLTLAKDILGDNWTTSKHFRFGASSLLDNLLSTLNFTDEKANSSNNY